MTLGTMIYIYIEQQQLVERFGSGKEFRYLFL